MTTIQKIIKIIAICLAIIIIINIFSLLLSLFTTVTNITFNNNSKEKITFTEVYDNIEKIEIDAIRSSISINQGTEFKVTTINLEKGLTTNLKNGTLEIEEHQSWFWQTKDVGSIIITIPAKIVLKELTIDTGAGKFEIANIEVEEFDIDHGAGILEITNSKFHKSDIDGGAGKIKITDTTLNNLDLDSGVGAIEIESSITGNSEINCGIGEINIILQGNEQDYRIKTQKGIGTIKINQEIKESGILGNGPNNLTIEGGVGNINLSFN